jgi:hypothetical protein
MSDAIEVTFKTPIPVVGQLMILEAVDHLYSLFALGEVGWREGAPELDDWQDLFERFPGKLLGPQNALYLTHMYPGSAKEIVKGLAGPVEKFIEFVALYRNKKRQAELKEAKQQLKLISEQLLPLLKQMSKAGIPKDKVERTIVKAYQQLDEVLDRFAGKGDFSLNAVSAATPGFRCPRCGHTTP